MYAKSSLNFYDPMECSPAETSIHRILQSGILEWVAIPSSRGSSRLMDRTQVSFLLHWRARSSLLVPFGKPVKSLGMYIINILIKRWKQMDTDSVQFSHSVISDSLQPHLISGHQASLSITNTQSLLKLMSIKSVISSNHLILCRPLLLLPSLSQPQRLFQWVSSSYQVAKVLEPQFQHQSFQWIFRADFLCDGLVGSPCCPRDFQESSPTPQFKSINSSVLSFHCGPALISIQDYWKNQSFD